MMEINISKKQSKNPHIAMCQMDGWKLVTLIGHFGCSCSGVA